MIQCLQCKREIPPADFNIATDAEDGQTTCRQVSPVLLFLIPFCAFWPGGNGSLNMNAIRRQVLVAGLQGGAKAGGHIRFPSVCWNNVTLSLVTGLAACANGSTWYQLKVA